MKRLALAYCLVAFALPAADARSSETIEHVVEPGETLWSIASLSDVYDDPYLWPVIYKFNRDQIKDPAKIYKGQRLQIPIHLDRKTRRISYGESGAAAPLAQ